MKELKVGAKGTCGGKPARVICTDLEGADSVAVAVVKTEGRESIVRVFSDGKYYSSKGCHSRNDFIPDIPYADFKMDEPVYVMDDLSHTRIAGHWAGANDNGTPMTWADGRTSHTSLSKNEWKYCIKAEDK